MNGNPSHASSVRRGEGQRLDRCILPHSQVTYISNTPSFDATKLRFGGIQLVKRPDSSCVIEPVLRVFKFLSDVVAVAIAVAEG